MLLNLQSLIDSFLLLFPSWVSNATPVVFGGGKTIDSLFSKKIFGKHKTLRGFFSGILSAPLIAVVFFFFYNDVFVRWGVETLPEAVALGFVEGIGAMTGDLFGSFIKRKKGLREGSEWFPDTFLFYIFSYIFSSLYIPALWNVWKEVILLTVLTILVHRISNIIANALRLKSVPW